MTFRVPKLRKPLSEDELKLLLEITRTKGDAEGKFLIDMLEHDNSTYGDRRRTVRNIVEGRSHPDAERCEPTRDRFMLRKMAADDRDPLPPPPRPAYIPGKLPVAARSQRAPGSARINILPQGKSTPRTRHQNRVVANLEKAIGGLAVMAGNTPAAQATAEQLSRLLIELNVPTHLVYDLLAGGSTTFSHQYHDKVREQLHNPELGLTGHQILVCTEVLSHLMRHLAWDGTHAVVDNSRGAKKLGSYRPYGAIELAADMKIQRQRVATALATLAHIGAISRVRIGTRHEIHLLPEAAYHGRLLDGQPAAMATFVTEVRPAALEEIARAKTRKKPRRRSKEIFEEAKLPPADGFFSADERDGDGTAEAEVA